MLKYTLRLAEVSGSGKLKIVLSIREGGLGKRRFIRKPTPGTATQKRDALRASMSVIQHPELAWQDSRTIEYPRSCPALTR